MCRTTVTRHRSLGGLACGESPCCESLEPRALLSMGPIPPMLSYLSIDRSTPVVADVDLDGFDDVVVPELQGISFRRNDGSGNFEPARFTRMRSGFWSIAAGDLNRDGYLDLAATATKYPNGGHGLPSSSYIRALLFDPELGRFVVSAATNSAPPVAKVFVADIDPAPGAELIHFDDRLISIHSLNAESGTLGQLGELAWDGVFQSSLLAGDIDDDGDLELIASENSTTGSTIVAFHRSDAHEPLSFTRHELFQFAGDFKPSLLRDLDGDGDLDIVGVQRENHHRLRYVVASNDGAGLFEELRIIRSVFISANRDATGRVIGTLPGDGAAPDLIVTEVATGYYPSNLGPNITRVYRLARSEDGCYTSTRLLLQRVHQSAEPLMVTHVGDLSVDGPDDPLDFVASRGRIAGTYIYRAEESAPTVLSAFPFGMAVGTSQLGSVSVNLWDPRDFLQPSPSLLRVEVALDLNENGVVDSADFIVKRRIVNTARRPELSIEFRITQDMPRGTFDLLFRSTGISSELTGPTLCLPDGLTIL